MAYPRPLDLSDQEIVGLPVDRLGFEILHAFSSGTQVHTYNFLNAWRNAGVQENGPPMHALAEACDWLRQRGLIAEPPGISDGFITRLGQRALDAGLPLVGAIAKLNENLHRRIESVRTQFLLGEYELAAFAAMKQVEIRVRELGGFDDADIGRHLMRAAFKPGDGPLHDSSLEAGEQSGRPTCSPGLSPCSRIRRAIASSRSRIHPRRLR